MRPPVPTTTPVAVPLSTLVPRKQMFFPSKGEAGATASRASNFSTGRDSPVRLAWMMNRSLLESRRRSAGIMSPADKRTMSPGTSSDSGTSRAEPPRITVAVTRIMAFSLAAAVLALVSWTKRNATPKTTIMTITTAARRSPVSAETTARSDNKITRGLSRALTRRSR